MSLFLMFAALAANTTVAPAPEAVAPKKERMICKAEKFVGSNRTRRICLTESQWREAREGAHDTLDRLGRGNKYCQPGPSCGGGE